MSDDREWAGEQKMEILFVDNLGKDEPNINNKSAKVHINENEHATVEQDTGSDGIFQRADKFRKLSRQISTGMSTESDLKFLDGLRGLSSERTRDNLLVPPSPIHRKAGDVDEYELHSHIYEGGTPTNTLDLSLKLFEPTQTSPEEHYTTTNKTTTDVRVKEEQLRSSFDQLNLSPEQLFSSLPIPPNSIFLPNSQHHATLISKLSADNLNTTRRTPRSSRNNSEIPSEELLADAGLEHLSKMNHDATNSPMGTSPTNANSKRMSWKGLSATMPVKKAPASPNFILDPDCIGLFLRSYFESSEKSIKRDRKFIKKFIFSSTPAEVQSHQLKAYGLFYDSLLNSSQKKLDKITGSSASSIKKFIERSDIVLGSPPPMLKLNNYVLDFNSYNEPCALGRTLTEEFTISNKGRDSLHFKFEIDKITTNDYSFTVCPSSGEVKKDKKMSIVVTFTLYNKMKRVQELLVLEVKGGARYYMGLEVICDKRQYGTSLKDVEMTYVDGIGMVPKVLVLLKHLLIKHKAYESQGIFRLNGNDVEVKRIKNEINMDNFNDIEDVNVNDVANLIKIWFRELPSGILDEIPHQKLIDMNITAENRVEKTAELLDQLSEPNRALLFWVLALISDFAKFESISKMNLENPMMLMILANKLAGHLAHMVLVYRYQQESSKSEGSCTEHYDVEPLDDENNQNFDGDQQEWNEYYRKLDEWEKYQEEHKDDLIEEQNVEYSNKVTD
ncbi:hypothetical protein AKO1_014645 [Acrasis kona]|uniref:Rho-GAP domain-containing protein n=1 Tax=Acrasis kona TaxID=1008807 RepID=A0AAW2Z256_9EUKA